MRKAAFVVIALLAGLVVMDSCESEKAPAPIIDSGGLVADSALYTYTLRTQAIFNTKCSSGSGCHGASSTQAGIRLDSYEACTTAVKTKPVICSIEHGSGCKPMPDQEPRMPDSTITAIKVWQARNFPL